MKIGITVIGAERIRQHQRHGWQLVCQLPCSTGEHAWRIEQGVLTLLRRSGIGPFLTAECMPQGGFTETVDVELVSAARLWALIRAEATNHTDHAMD